MVSPDEFLPWGMALSNEIFYSPSLLNVLGIAFYPFLHANLLHLILNSVVFASIGALLESTLTKKLFTRILVIATIAPALSWLLLSQLAPTVGGAAVVGSSGLVYAMFGGCLCLFPNLPLNLILIEIKLWMASTALIAYSFFATVAQLCGYQSQTAHAIHFLGAACGWLLLGGHRRFAISDFVLFKYFAQRKRQSVQQRLQHDKKRVDDILAKVSLSGIASLSSAERKFLEQQSRKK